MSLAYLINCYPQFSQSFIRREILALEAAGTPVQRFSIRSGAHNIVDPADKQELAKTRIVLDQGAAGLVVALLFTGLTNPLGLWRGLKLALKTGQRSDRGLIYNLIYLVEACVLLRWFRQSGVRHVHAHFGTNSTDVVMLCHAMGGPTFSFTVHGPEEFDRVIGISLAEKIKRSAFVVAISHFGKSQLSRWCEFADWDKLKIVHCGVDDAYLERTPQPVPSAPNLVCVGRLSEQKGQMALLEAAHRLAQLGVPFQLTLVGDGPLRSPLEAKIKAYQLQDQVKITGVATASQVQEYLNNARAFVLPSFGEGLPVAIMEALAMGRPVVTTYIAGIPELVQPGVNGWLVPAGSVEDLTDALKEAIALSPAELDQMGLSGVAAVRAQHCIHTEAAKLAALFAQHAP
jgi:colanic acid/amylovoran biosynthesis glycosyltransferase